MKQDISNINAPKKRKKIQVINHAKPQKTSYSTALKNKPTVNFIFLF